MIVQFLLLAVIVFTGETGSTVAGWVHTIRTALILVGLVIGVTAILQMRKFLRVTPMPAEGAVLLRTGVYGLIRHPMYTSLLCLTAGITLGKLWYMWLVWVVLLAVLMAKSKYEEGLLQARFPGYKEYMKEVGGLLPGLGVGKG